jgi:hypothetical protein
MFLFTSTSNFTRTLYTISLAKYVLLLYQVK